MPRFHRVIAASAFQSLSKTCFQDKADNTYTDSLRFRWWHPINQGGERLCQTITRGGILVVFQLIDQSSGSLTASPSGLVPVHSTRDQRNGNRQCIAGV